MRRPSSASDDDGGNPANIAAGGASNPTERDARAALKLRRTLVPPVNLLRPVHSAGALRDSWIIHSGG